MRIAQLLTILVLVSGCANQSSGLLGSIFRSDSDCESKNCDQDPLVTTRDEHKAWYCYASSADGEWLCGDRQQTDLQQAELATPSSSGQNPTAPALPAVAANRVDMKRAASSILRQPPNYYTVQIIALTTEESILQFASESGVNSPLYAPISSDAGTIFVLLLGVYPDVETATVAKNKWITTDATDSTPWVRQLGPLQDAIRLAAR